MSDESAPSVWELSRALTEMRGNQQGYLSKDVFEGYRASQAEKLRDMQIQIDRLDAVIEDMRKTRAAQWFSIGLAVLTAITSIGIALLNHALG